MNVGGTQSHHLRGPASEDCPDGSGGDESGVLPVAGAGDDGQGWVRRSASRNGQDCLRHE